MMFRLFILLVLINYVLGQPYVTYSQGALPLVLSAPHGGSLRPTSIPDRESGCYISSSSSCDFNHTCTPKSPTNCPISTAADLNTLQLTNEISDALYRLTGNRPSIVINQLHRIKLDPNRDVDEGAQGVPEAIKAWNEFQSIIAQYTASVASRCGRGFYMDIHGQAHSEEWVEWGYLLSKDELNNNNDNQINSLASSSSINTLSQTSSNTFAELIRGSVSFGTMMSSPVYGSYKSVPSQTYPGPGNGQYFSGGYNTKTHGSLNGGTIDAVQMEVNSGVRQNAEKRLDYASNLAKVFYEWFKSQYHIDLKSDACIVSYSIPFSNSTKFMDLSFSLF